MKTFPPPTSRRSNAQPEVPLSQASAQVTHEDVQLWLNELAEQLEVQPAALNIAELVDLAQRTQSAVNNAAIGPTAYLIGYVTASLEAQGVADASAVARAALRVTDRLLERRDRAVG